MKKPIERCTERIELHSSSPKEGVVRKLENQAIFRVKEHYSLKLNSRFLFLEVDDF